MELNRSMPSAQVIPVLPYPDVGRAIEWLSTTFGFGLRWRVADHRAQLNVGNGCVAITKGQVPPDSGQSIMVRIEDVDAHYLQAKASGAQILKEPAEYPYGERQYSVQDLAGHVWTFSQTVADVAPEDWGGISANL